MAQAKYIDNLARLGIGIILLICATLLVQQGGLSDFVQDYAAAWGWWHNYDTSSLTNQLLSLCCADQGIYYLHDDIRTAHPPLATLITLPFALLPWTMAQMLWLVCGWLAVVGSWYISRTPIVLCLVSAAFWILALAIGALEPFMFILLTIAFVSCQRAPIISGVCLGACAALKIYPALLIVGFILSIQRRVATAAIVTGIVLALVGELVLGLGVTLSRLQFIGINTLYWVDRSYNLSLVRMVRAIVPDASPTLVALALGLLFIPPLIPRLRKEHAPQILLPVILLISPLSWAHYLGVLTLNALGSIEKICLFIAGILLLLVSFNLIPADDLAPIAFGPILLALLCMLYRQIKPKNPPSTALNSEIESPG